MNIPALARPENRLSKSWLAGLAPAIALALPFILPINAHAQPVTTPWGNVIGIQLDGERMGFETSLRAVNPDWSGFVQSSKYNWEGTQRFTLSENTYTCAHFLQGTQLNYTTKVAELERGCARITVQTELKEPLSMAGAFFCINLPAGDYTGARLELIGSDNQPLDSLPNHSGSLHELTRVKARGFRLTGPSRKIEVLADEPTELILRQDFVDQPDYLNDPHPRMRFVQEDREMKSADYQVYFSVLPAHAPKGATAQTGYRIKVDGHVDKAPVKLSLSADKPGRAFAGISGNFRMQYPELDTQVTDYCLANLNVTWGRIAFPWTEWQPEEQGDASAKVLAGGMSSYFYDQIEIARTLARRKIPLIVSVWTPPSWAVDPRIKIPKGVKLDAGKLQKSADSIANWLVFLKEHYGVEAALFSFNETDYGVEVHQSPEEHALANKVIGATFAARGLATKMLLGDTGACTLASHKVVEATERDRSILPYLGGISFHTYHGVTDADLKAWADTARATNLPLLCTEGGPDSAAHRYPLVWVTPWFALLEVDQYIRVGAACQPNTIMPWQLNSDYSLLAGGGIYNDHGPLRPTQRFWNIKQLGSMPQGSYWLPVSADRPNIHCAALGDIAGGSYAVHITNNGATRQATLEGLPSGVKKVRVYVTDGTRGMQLMAVKGVADGKTSFLLEAQAFTSLVSE